MCLEQSLIIDYYMFYVDLKGNEPGAFYWQRMKPVKILKSEVGIDGEYLKDLRLNSWVKEKEKEINDSSITRKSWGR